MPTFANTINGNEILAKRSQCDYAGNDLQTTYATKTEVSTGLASKEDSANKAQTLDPSSTTDFPSSAATANYVNSSVATATANFLGNFTLQELGLTYPATDAQIGAALDAHTWPAGVTPTNNDYTYIEIENPQTTGIDDSVERFKFNGTNWVYEYTLNNSSFTSAEKAAIDSGITSSDVSAYNTHIADTDIHVTTSDKSTWNGKQDAINDLSTIRSGAQAGATAVQPGDLSTVAVSGDYDDLLNKPVIPTVPVQDVTVDGTSVLNAQGVASITMPTELVPAVGSGDNAKVLTAAYDSDTGTGSYSWKVPEGLFIARYGTSTYAEVDAAARAGKIVYCYVNGRFAFLAYTNTTGGSDYNYEFQYYRSAASGKDSVFIYKVRPAGSIYGPEWGTTQRDVKAGNIWYPVTNVKVNGSSVMSGTVAEITLPTIPVTDVEVDGTSVVNASGVAEITMPTELVPTVTSSDDGKVLKAAYSGGTGSYSWETESGGGGADWDAQSGEPGYIENKPVPKTLVAGTGITVTENSTQLVVASTNQLYSAGNGLTLNNATFAVDTSVVATQNDLSGYATLNDIPAVDQTYDGTSANAQSGVAVASGISDAVAALPTNLSSAQIQALKEALGVDETVLWTGTENDSGVSTFTLSELSTNFERLRFYGLSYGSTRVQYECPAPTSATEAISIAYNYFCSVTDNNPWQLRAANFTTQDGLTYSYGGMEKFAYGTQTGTAFASSPTDRCVPIYKIVGIHRIASN